LLRILLIYFAASAEKIFSVLSVTYT